MLGLSLASVGGGLGGFTLNLTPDGGSAAAAAPTLYVLLLRKSVVASSSLSYRDPYAL